MELMQKPFFTSICVFLGAGHLNELVRSRFENGNQNRKQNEAKRDGREMLNSVYENGFNVLHPNGRADLSWPWAGLSNKVSQLGSVNTENVPATLGGTAINSHNAIDGPGHGLINGFRLQQGGIDQGPVGIDNQGPHSLFGYVNGPAVSGGVGDVGLKTFPNVASLGGSGDANGLLNFPNVLSKLGGNARGGDLYDLSRGFGGIGVKPYDVAVHHEFDNLPSQLSYLAGDARGGDLVNLATGFGGISGSHVIRMNGRTVENNLNSPLNPYTGAPWKWSLTNSHPEKAGVGAIMTVSSLLAQNPNLNRNIDWRSANTGKMRMLENIGAVGKASVLTGLINGLKGGSQHLLDQDLSGLEAFGEIVSTGALDGWLNAINNGAFNNGVDPQMAIASLFNDAPKVNSLSGGSGTVMNYGGNILNDEIMGNNGGANLMNYGVVNAAVSAFLEAMRTPKGSCSGSKKGCISTQLSPTTVRQALMKEFLRKFSCDGNKNDYCIPFTTTLDSKKLKEFLINDLGTKILKESCKEKDCEPSKAGHKRKRKTERGRRKNEINLSKLTTHGTSFCNC